MFRKQTSRALLTIALAGLLALTAHAQGEEHGNDIRPGRNENHGRSGPGTAFWFGDDPDRFQTWITQPHTMQGHVDAAQGIGRIYYNLGWDTIRTFNGSVNAPVLQSATLQAVAVSPGIEMRGPSNLLLFSSDAGATAYNNSVPFPFTGSWHRHFLVRAWRPGTYTITFKLADARASEGGGIPLADSDAQTLILRNRPTLRGRVALPGWQRVDASPNQNQNLARVYIFPAGSKPAGESQAISHADVFLDQNGVFLVPENLQRLDNFQPLAEGSYRIGIKPITAPGLARLFRGDIALSAAAPLDLSSDVLSLPLGDVNRDGRIDGSDRDIVQAGAPNGDVNGDGTVNQTDLNLVYASFGGQAFVERRPGKPFADPAAVR